MYKTGMLIAAVSGLSAALGAAWSAPPRYDGAGYAVLAQALLHGQGYRAIDHPDRPQHAHFPPGYPLLLAAVWRVTGVSAISARAVSVACTIGATLSAWCWFRRMMPVKAADRLALALAVNWLWVRTGAAIQSEPLYLFLGQLLILAAARGAPALGIGTLLAACLMTRHVAIGLAMGVLIDLVIRRQGRRAAIVAATAAVLVAPWVIWLAVASSRTQADLLRLPGGETWAGRIAGQLVFYLQRIPDQVTGPFVEVATSFGRPGPVVIAANLWATAGTAIIALGWVRCVRRNRWRLAGLVPLITLPILLPWPYTEAGRLLLPMIPCILVGALEGLAIGLRWLRPSRRRTIAASLVLAASLPYSLYSLAAGKVRAAEESQRDFDAACAWLARQPGHPGPVLARHPGEVFWQTGRQAIEVSTSERPGDPDADTSAIARTIDRYRVEYLLIDRDRYAREVVSPLSRFVERFPDRVRAVWHGSDGQASKVAIYEVTSSESR